MCLPWTDGYCSTACEPLLDLFFPTCGAGAICGQNVISLFFGSSPGACREVCNNDLDCRWGYSCRADLLDLLHSELVCLPD